MSFLHFGYAQHKLRQESIFIISFRHAEFSSASHCFRQNRTLRLRSGSYFMRTWNGFRLTYVPQR